MRYSIHDRKTVFKLLQQAALGMKRHAEAVFIKTGTRPVVTPFETMARRARKIYDRHCGNTSKYKPHQGKAECARRIRQGLAG